MKIVYVYATFATVGGTERIITEKANYLAEKYGYDVTIINTYQLPDEANAFVLSEKVKQINLGVPYLSPYKYKYPKRLWIKWENNRLLRKRLNDSIQQVDPDILIGIAQFKSDIVIKTKCRAKKIIECHEARIYTMSGLGSNYSFIKRILMNIHRHHYFRTIERNADVIATLTEGDKTLWKRAKHVEVIPNFSLMPIRRFTDWSPKRVIAVGRLEWEKGFGRLLEVWKIVSYKHPDWNLEIFGEGSMEGTLKILIRTLNVKNIIINSFTKDISLEYANSSICVVTSYFEGFSLVILEALKHGVPCVVFDCPFGPGSIIEDARSGFIVENGDTRLFAERVCRLIQDKELRSQFAKAGIERAKQFNVDIIMNQWKSLFENLINQN